MAEDKAATWDLAVVGGGVIGLAIAWRAARRGVRTVLLERDRVGTGTSHHAAGMIAPVAEVAPGEEALLELGMRSARMYPQWIEELAVTSEAPAGYNACGTLLVARDDDEAEALSRELTLRERIGLPVTRLRASEARRREPALTPSLRLALDVPGDHAIDPRSLTAALAVAVRRDGGEIREGVTVTSVGKGELGLADGTRLRTARTVLAPGVWGEGIEGVAPIGLRPVKGQIMRLHDPGGPGLVTRVIRRGSSYIVPRGDGRYVIGATSEEQGHDVSVTAGAALQILRDASEVVPGISELVLDEFTAGLRPGTPDNLPVIGPSSMPGVWWATGHFRGGVLLAPVTAELVLDMLDDRAIDPLAAALHPDRGPQAVHT